jgi:hypothetical protein
MKSFVLGYHGCDRSVAERLLAGKSEFKSSSNAHDWLGHGIYFWENNPKRAVDWASVMAKHPVFSKRVKLPYAVGAVIDLGNTLDLTEAISLDMVAQAYEGLTKLLALSATPLPQNKPGSDEDEDLVRRYLDCAVINYLHQVRKEENLTSFPTVRAAFHEGKPLYPGSAIRCKTHIQICVRNPIQIKGIFRIPNIDQWIEEVLQ